jgi:hypothetical protein
MLNTFLLPRFFMLMAVTSPIATSVFAADTPPPAVVKTAQGAIVGILTNAAKAPVAGAMVTAVRADG